MDLAASVAHTFRPVGAVLYAWPDVGRRSSVMPWHGRIFTDCFRDGFKIPGELSRSANGVGWLKPRLRDVSISNRLRGAFGERPREPSGLS